MPAAKPQVTGISPREGRPGKQITIRGENLGLDAADLISVKINGYECLPFAEYQSPHKILCRAGPAVGEGDVIVSTRSGGEGSCTVTFCCDASGVDPQEEMAFWAEEVDPFADPRSGPKRVRRQKSGDVDPLNIRRRRFPRVPSAAAELEKLYPEGTSDLTSESFVPARFLIERHRDTNFANLRTGLRHLRDVSSERTTGPKALIKNNLDTFIECHDTLTAMHQLLLRNESMSEGGNLTEKLEYILKDSVKCAEELFHDVLSRKDRADATRNALNVMQRFRFLFSLPRNIERNIRNGEYEIVINDYERAKSLFSDTDVQVFKKVLEEVEHLVNNFRGQLGRKLQELPSTLDEQKKLIRYLIELNAEGDPAWDCITNQHQWILKLIQSCKADFQSTPRSAGANAEPSVSDSKHNRSLSGSSFSGRQAPLRNQGFLKEEQKIPRQVLFVEELSALITESLPDLWRLSQAYFSGSLVQGMGEAVKLSMRNPSGESKLLGMLREITVLYADLIQASFFPEFLDKLKKDGPEIEKRRANVGDFQLVDVAEDSGVDKSSAWLPFCVRQVRATLSSLNSLALPSNVLNCIQEVGSELQRHCANILTEQIVSDVHHLHIRENWNVETDEGGCITSLPVLFENIVMDWVLSLKEVVLEEKAIDNKSARLHVMSTQLFCNVLQAFADCLSELATNLPTSSSEEEQPTQLYPSGGEDEFLPGSTLSLNETADEIPPRAKQLLIILSNCAHAQEFVVARLVNFFNSHGYPGADEAKRLAQESLQKVDKQVFQMYIDQKSQPVLGRLEPGMFAGQFDYSTCQEPKDVRSYLKETLLEMVQVHVEVFSISPQLVQRVMSSLLDMVADEVARILQGIEEFSSNGALQAKLELLALEQCLATFKTEHAATVFKQARGQLKVSGGPNDQKLLLDLLTDFRQRNKLQLLCFQGKTQTRRT